ncbi:MAG: PEP-CTERM sorting domain-containing protein [Planctomycetota bacterium]
MPTQMFNVLTGGFVTVTTLAIATASPTASAAVFTDAGNSGDFFGTANQMAIFNTGQDYLIDGSFEVSFTTYDGDGGTLEDDKALGTIDYHVANIDLGLPAGETFTGVEIDTATWDGRSNFDGQSESDIYMVQLSDDGVTFGAPIVLGFTTPVVSSNPGFVLSTGSADGFFADYVRISILSRVEAAGSGANDPWSSRIEEIRLTSGVIPEPASLALVGAGVALAGLRRRRAAD